MIYILGLLAKSGHGKTTVARHLVDAHGAQIRSLAGPMKRAVRSVFGFSDGQLWGSQADKEAIDRRYGFSPRWLLQRLGTEGLRAEFGEDVHVRAVVAVDDDGVVFTASEIGRASCRERVYGTV